MESLRLKISFLLPNRGLGGGVRAIVRFANELLARGHSVRIFYRNDVNGLHNRLKKVYRRIRYGFAYDWLWDFNGEAFCYNVLDPKLFATDELVVSMCAKTTFDAWSLPKDIGIKVLHCHGTEIANWEQMLKSWELPIPKLVVSSHLSDLMKKEVNQEPLGVVPNGVDTDQYFPCLLESERTGIGAGFRWGHTKDPISTLKIFQMLKKQMPDVLLYSFGSSKIPRELRHIIYCNQPTIEEARRIYSSCKIWFLASIKEGFGLPVLEAMACGCAVVSTDCGGPSDIIKDAENGFLVDIGNIGAMVYKIVKLYQDDELREYVRSNALDTVRDFSWSNGTSKLEKYLYDIYKNNIESTLKR